LNFRLKTGGLECLEDVIAHRPMLDCSDWVRLLGNNFQMLEGTTRGKVCERRARADDGRRTLLV
jgi:hypothetical protein